MDRYNRNIFDFGRQMTTNLFQSSLLYNCKQNTIRKNEANEISIFKSFSCNKLLENDQTIKMDFNRNSYYEIKHSPGTSKIYEDYSLTTKIYNFNRKKILLKYHTPRRPLTRAPPLISHLKSFEKKDNVSVYFIDDLEVLL
jgi:hypothetical protein